MKERKICIEVDLNTKVDQLDIDELSSYFKMESIRREFLFSEMFSSPKASGRSLFFETTHIVSNDDEAQENLFQRSLDGLMGALDTIVHQGSEMYRKAAAERVAPKEPCILVRLVEAAENRSSKRFALA